MEEQVLSKCIYVFRGGGRSKQQWLLGALSSSTAGARIIPGLIPAALWYLTEHSSDKTQGQIRGMSHRCPGKKRKEKRCERAGGKQKEDDMTYCFLFPTQKQNLPFLVLCLSFFLFVINPLWLCQTYAQTMQQIKTRHCRRPPTHSNGSCFPKYPTLPMEQQLRWTL